MSVNKTLDQILAAIRPFLPKGPPGVDEKMRAVLHSLFERLDLVTREELDVQEEVLARTRASLAEMERRVAELERKRREPG